MSLAMRSVVTMDRAEAVIRFWADEIGEANWYVSEPEIDQKIRDGFATDWAEAAAGGLGHWLTGARGTLAYLIVTDQFSRNLFRADGRAFALDASARAAAKFAIDQNWDQDIDPPLRQFFFMPLMHSENLIDQDRSVVLFATRMGGENSNILHAEAHREVIRRYGRFPHRNALLGRDSTPGELAYDADGGYGAIVRAMQAKD